jgi:uncharacterized membrane protein YvbJ
MWTCEKCGEEIEDQFVHCSKCAAMAPPVRKTRRQRVTFRVFESGLDSWHTLLIGSAFA